MREQIELLGSTAFPLQSNVLEKISNRRIHIADMGQSSGGTVRRHTLCFLHALPPTEERIIATLTHLRQRMKDNGLLILEVGVALDNGQKLLEVARSDGTVHYPTWEMLVKLINRSGLVWRRSG